MTASTFVLSDLVTGRWLGGAVVATEARYALLLLTGADRPQLLGERRTHSLTLQRLSEIPIGDELAEVGRKLDALLRSFVPPALSLRQDLA